MKPVHLITMAWLFFFFSRFCKHDSRRSGGFNTGNRYHTHACAHSLTHASVGNRESVTTVERIVTLVLAFQKCSYLKNKIQIQKKRKPFSHMLLFWNTWDPREDTRRVSLWCRATGSRTAVIRQEASEQRCDNFKQDLKTCAHVRVTGASVTAHQTMFPR